MPVCYRFISVDEECCNIIASSSVDDDISLSSPSPQHPPCFNLLQQFYDELMIPTFTSSQRDDINDWYECFRVQIKLHRHRIYIQKQKDIKDALTNGLQEEGVASKIQQLAYCNDIKEDVCECNPVMDVILMVVDDKQIGAEENSRHHIIGGAVMEYYKQSRVGLLSYIVLHNQYRGHGFAKPLHDEALSQLEVLANNYSTDNIDGELSSQNKNLQAIFAETNTVAAGDVTSEQCLNRHKSLYNLGYRLVHFPYAQPPLSTKDVDASFNDIVLLVYFPMNVDQLTNDLYNRELIQRYCQWFLEKDIENNTNPQTAQMNVDVPFHFIEEFYQVVFCLNTADGLPDYRTSKYYSLAKKFSTHNRLVGVSLCSPSIPFENCRESLLVEYIESS